MAMNFKVFNDVDQVAQFTADIIRKQFNNNPTTIAGLHLDRETAPVLDELKKDVDRNPVDFSQINILDYDENRSYYEALGVPSSQIYPINLDDDATSLIDDKIKTKENKGKLILQVTSIDEKGSLNVNVRQGLMKAREVVLVITGGHKREFVKKLYEENGKSSFEPADLKVHRMVTVVLDRAAAEGLPEDVKEYFTAHFA
ncbi:glucosamine-6-phosphate isomerase [Staphylococcus petrasii]|uniref:Glucosamine-6-phosphate isomerase n=1 Tax=Staphylococcus petrasii TaxID=1276936 RepID=A0A380FYA8_9STAP|nr:glucosamine-6-phosphate isomerase [Staphylococcus petrasii]MCI2775276.1 glucosamine-6-phosphate isomerase [Staphylococcus petrasii]PNZ24890.1 glucosamine-6-phosphate isomerase [Staphylococcus petrasii]PNZ83055.1 glucosamine-6-phosphate isomerase [Staphylococcus petrasii]SUM43854.1 glucosamine-6-phosphate isomerase [Staphylococcus petrasii]SUM59706.1 glucosamine-6-phosphate isomerase [Staphylococcus petrasii]